MIYLEIQTPKLELYLKKRFYALALKRVIEQLEGLVTVLGELYPEVKIEFRVILK